MQRCAAVAPAHEAEQQSPATKDDIAGLHRHVEEVGERVDQVEEKLGEVQADIRAMPLTFMDVVKSLVKDRSGNSAPLGMIRVGH